MSLFQCVSGRDMCVGGSSKAKKKEDLIHFDREKAERGINTPADIGVILEHLWSSKRKCTFCSTRLKRCQFYESGKSLSLCKTDNERCEEKRAKEIKFAKVGSSYFAFCDESCWAQWLPQFSQPSNQHQGVESKNNADASQEVKPKKIQRRQSSIKVRHSWTNASWRLPQAQLL